MASGRQTARWALAVGLLAALVVVALALPLESTLTALRTWVDARGVLGMVAFASVYVALVLLLVPGAALTLVAGAIYGIGRGVVVVAIATSVADAIGFLLARYVARGAVERLMVLHPRFRAIDQALARGGWHVVALLRLNPAIPYSASNYLFGATGVRFLPYLVASGVFTLPGAFTYVYLGYVGAEALGGSGRARVEWVLLVVGLGATVAAAVYLTMLARRSLAELERRRG